MPADPKTQIERILTDGVKQIALQPIEFYAVLEKPRRPEHGDYSSTAPLQLAKILGRSPRQIGEELKNVTASAIAQADLCEPLELAGAGFLNIRLKGATKQAVIPEILSQGGRYGRAANTNAEKVMVEFVSANPTGPLHVGHGRQAALGDAIAALLEAQGHAVTREFYYNDAGAQIEALALSVQARVRGVAPGGPGWPADGYAGEYIEDIAKGVANPDDLEAIRKYAVSFLRKEQDADLQ